MTDNHGNLVPSETTPLLISQENGSPRESISNGALATTNGAGRSDEETLKGNDLDAARAAQFQGLPDANKKLKYIVPAVAIGVSMLCRPFSSST